MRTACVKRTTRETDVSVSLSLDGGPVSISTGIGFFDHMLTAFAVHGGFGLQAAVKGDLQVDGHHTVEDLSLIHISCTRPASRGHTSRWMICRAVPRFPRPSSKCSARRCV